MSVLVATLMLGEGGSEPVEVYGDVRISADRSEYEVTLLGCLDGRSLDSLYETEKERAKDALAAEMRKAELEAGADLR